MRIISGSHKGRSINPPAGLTLRPTTDYAKEALFNIIESRIDLDGAEVLDLFAGTGSISYEFASRGCSRVVSIEQNPECVHFIITTLNAFDFQQIQVYRRDVFRSLDLVKGPFDVVFADPPYNLKAFNTIPSLLLERGLLKPDGLLIIEHGSETNFSNHPHFVEERVYSRVHFSIFKP